MTSVLAAGGLLEGLARGTAALAPASPACQALSHILTQVCTQSQAPTAQSSLCIRHSASSGSSGDRTGGSGDATLQAPSGHPPLQPQGGTAMQQGAVAIACCQTWQVSAPHSIHKIPIEDISAIAVSTLPPVAPDHSTGSCSTAKFKGFVYMPRAAWG